MSKKAASPAATGPSGALLEARVGAFYLLAMLLDGEPRGLPGSRILRVQLQGATDDLPLDDVVVHCLTKEGQQATLDIQVKRSITFTPSDAVFAKVLSQIATAVTSGKLSSAERYLMGIATAQNTRKIDGPYQEVLQWARRSPSAAFFRKLNQPNVSNESMRTFVTTIRTRLSEYGAPADDDTVWQVLRHLQIFVFDFSDNGQSEALARERCRYALDPKDQDKAGALWSILIEIAQELAMAAGQVDLAQLRQLIGEKSGMLLAGARHNRDALSALTEASRQARESIRDRVAGAHLSRRARLDVVYESLDRGRYLEILGDAGVGKSGILRALADEIAIASNVIVMTPARVTPRGWTALRNEIGYQGSAADLLGDLAASGGGTIFVDSVDMLGDEQRATVTDLVRESARVPGLNVVVTARRSFGVDEPNWLPAEALDALGRAPSVVIDELSDDEVNELRSEAPELAPLLASGHPAQDAVRNLFRLEWLFQRGQQDGTPRTEADMARLWWQTGDGQSGDDARDRTRILRALARQSLTARDPYSTSDYDSGPLNALIKSGTLTEVKAEKVVFRHDVFRDWGIANLLNEDSRFYDVMPLSRPAPAGLFRGVELAARLALEGRSDAKDWITTVQRLRRAGVHGSWRRAAVLALVRSENSAGALALAEVELLAQDGALLRELVRTVMAVDTMPARQVFAGTQVVMPAGLEDYAMPVGPAWRRLVVWISQLDGKLPGAAVPDVIKLYASYAIAAHAVDPIVGILVEQLHAWLMMMEGRPRPAGEDGPAKPLVEHDQHHSLHKYLRSMYLALCSLKPALADEYLDFVLTNERAARASAESIVVSPGSLAVAAPTKLAELIAKTLIADNKPRARGHGSFERPEPFTHTDTKFLSPAPARGPFLALLNSDPKTGLALIRRIVKHASEFDASRKLKENDDSVTILLADGPRRFIDRGSYFWSRDGQGGSYSVTTGLMALEAWSHARMDRGDAVEDVIADILGEEELPAAFLLLVVDVVLSHWGKAWRAAVPFVASPELLAWDRSRQIHDRSAIGLGVFGDPEPKGSVTRESLQKRQSRATMLEQVLPLYTFRAPPEMLVDLRKKLEDAAERLGEYETHSDFGDPRFMARYALNVTDRAHYTVQETANADGETQSGYAYVSPSKEAAHLAALRETHGMSQEDAGRGAELFLALDDVNRSSPELVARAVPWARKVQESKSVQESFDNSVLIAAFLLMRDGTDEQRQEHGPWALALFEQCVVEPEDAVHRMRDGLRFNPVGIATAGLVLRASHEKTQENLRRLLEIAARGDPAAARGFGAFRAKLGEIDVRLPACLLRCAFAASVRPHLKLYGDGLSEDERRQAQVALWRKEALEAEWRWLSGADTNEPDWPSFPDPQVGVRNAIYIGDAPRRVRPLRKESAYYADHQAAGIWLLEFLGSEYTAPPWTWPIVDRYRDWTAALNGSGLENEVELYREPDGWNHAYFTLVARSLVGLDAKTIDRVCLQPLLGLPDRPFLDVMDDLVLALDVVHFEGYGPEAAEAVRIRAQLIERLMRTSQWRNFSKRSEYGITLDLDGALGAALMCRHAFRHPPRCYVTTIGIGRAEIFAELLTALAEATPSLFVAKAVLSIASVSEEHPFATLCVKAIEACMAAFPDDTKFWVDYEVGDEFCAWLERCLQRFGLDILDRENLRVTVEGLLSQLIRVGVSTAAALERRITPV